jgi:hypothetical protein
MVPFSASAEQQILFGLLSPRMIAGGIHHRVDQGLVAGAAAGVAVAVEPVAHLLARRVVVVVEQHLGRHHEAGRADAALRAAVSHPGDLQRDADCRRMPMPSMVTI